MSEAEKLLIDMLKKFYGNPIFNVVEVNDSSTVEKIANYLVEHKLAKWLNKSHTVFEIFEPTNEK